MRFLLTIYTLLVTAVCSGQTVDDSLQHVSPAADKASTTWGSIKHRGNPWVNNTSRPYKAPAGMPDRHVSIWPSHGRYYDKNSGWLWQRPNLFCTSEDQLTQTFAVPYLYPMLEHAGAIVWSPRERSWRREEVIVDNDAPTKNGLYAEQNGLHEWTDAGAGFAWKRKVYYDKQNPHKEGTSRKTIAQSSKKHLSTITYTPDIPREGEYAVYVSYPSLGTNVPDARYTVYHKGIKTNIKVNQQMGGGTWVYLGTFDFAAGQNKQNSISLSNYSDYRGTVAADAIRIGGGMGNVARTDSTGRAPKLSGLPRYLEGARYAQQWNGLPYETYAHHTARGDYNDDILIRPVGSNYLARGSQYLPGDSGLNVPIEMTLAMHSDAGFTKDMSTIGTLSIYTSEFEDGVFPSGVSRMAAGNFSTMMLSQIKSDLNTLYGNWAIRSNLDKNYGETRVPRVPGIILEMFSHQNFGDMVLAHDPTFKFHLARSIYKTMLRFSAQMHQQENIVVQPLPIQAFSAELNKQNRQVVLRWKPTEDVTEPSATPTAYVVYQRRGKGGWDNGTIVREPQYTKRLDADVLYRFKVEALNEGGASMPSEELCAALSSNTHAPNILIVNGFTRLAAPQVVNTDSLRGFDFNRDPGVADRATAGFCGKQRNFKPSNAGLTRENALGYSTQEWVGRLIKGNTFDYPGLHAEDMMLEGSFNIASCSRLALSQGTVKTEDYQMLDVIMGAQRSDGYSRQDFKSFTPEMKQMLNIFSKGGGAVLVSGAYVGSDMQSDDDKIFTQDVLSYQANGSQRADSLLTIQGLGTQVQYSLVPNEEHLSTAYTSVLTPTDRAQILMEYSNSNSPAAVGYKDGVRRTITLGFPLEQITEDKARRQLMKGIIKWLELPKSL